MKLISNIEHGLTLLQHASCLAVVHHRRCEQAQAGLAFSETKPDA